MTSILPSEMFEHYRQVNEAKRLVESEGELELLRTRDLIRRHLPKPPATILDVGGAAGVHALWLARQGYDVHLIDPVAHHVEQARIASQAQATSPLKSCTVGDARELRRANGSTDAVVMLGPLYHLTERMDRLQALREARRVLRPNGVIFVAAISRFASLLSGMTYGFLGDPTFVQTIRQDLKDGQHRNPTNNPAYFTTTFFHLPDELKNEMEEAEFTVQKIVAIEGPVMWMKSFDADWKIPERKTFLLEILCMIEHEPAVVATGAHFLGVAQRPI